MQDDHAITDAEQLRALIGEPMDLLDLKMRSELDEQMKQYVRLSPLIFVTTLDAQGRPDVSPKGDPAGFVHIDAQGRLLIPERPGNRLTFGFNNILRDNRIGLIFIVPGVRETLRVKGRASLHKDPEVLAAMAVNGKPAIMFTCIEVEDAFFHCGKAMIRSRAWKPEFWNSSDESHMAKQFAATMNGDAELAKSIEAEIEKNYGDELY
ncbi:MAG: pyridoxamine 5'-phosphate oxidase family protein [Gammaproteobacteria bacterium]|nr:pyridoxamine 5'-phosphate oxidase family protein [Gammaproteobacteria bacterium]